MEPQTNPIKINKANIPLLICPECRTNIPNLRLYPTERKMHICSICPCSKENKIKPLDQFIREVNQIETKGSQCSQHERKAEQYCFKCLLWLCQECEQYHQQFASKHILIQHELNIQCTKHHKQFSFLCRKCRINLCKDCQVNHRNHKLIALNLLDPMLPQFNLIEDVMSSNKQVTAQLCKESDQDIIKEDLQSVFLINEAINEDLRLLYQTICKTANVFRSYPLFELTKLQQTIIINQTKYQKTNKPFETKMEILIEHLKGNYILQHNATNDCSILKGHTDSLSCFVELNDGRLASCSSDQSIKVWNLDTKQCEATLKGSSSSIMCIVELNDGRIASAAFEKVIHIMNIATNKCEATLIGHRSYIYALALLNDGRLASGGFDRAIMLWDTTTKEIKATLEGHSDSITSLVTLKDGRIASLSYDKTIRLWNTTLYQCMTIFRYDASCLIELSDGKLVVAGAKDWGINIYTIPTLKCMTTLRAHTATVTSLVELIDGRLASGSNDYTIRLWNISTNECTSEIKDDNVADLIQLNDGRLASISTDSNIRFWDV